MQELITKDIFQTIENESINESTTANIVVAQRTVTTSADLKAFADAINPLKNHEGDNVDRFLKLAGGKILTIGDGNHFRDWYVYDDKLGKFTLDNASAKRFYDDVVVNEILDDCRKFTLEAETHRTNGTDDKQLLKDIDEYKKWYQTSKRASMRRNVLDTVFNQVNVGNSVDDYFDTLYHDQFKTYFNCQNVTLEFDIKSGEVIVLPHSKEYRVTKVANVKYDPSAKCPLWEDRMQVFMCGDLAAVRYLQALLGISLAGITKDQKFIIMPGSGRNGKSTTLKHIQELMGDYAIKCDASLFTKGDAKRDGNVLADVRGRRFAWCAEGNNKAVIDTDMLKSVTGGEDVVYRANYQAVSRFKPQFLPIFATNSLPSFYDSSDGVKRRARIVEFNFQVALKDIDPMLDEKLEKEYSGILNWMIAGFKLWAQSHSLTPLETDKIRRDSDGYVLANDLIAQFALEELIDDSSCKTSIKLLYNRYCSWAMENGRRAVAKNEFVDRMVKLYASDNTETAEDGSIRRVVYRIHGGDKAIRGVKVKPICDFIPTEVIE